MARDADEAGALSGKTTISKQRTKRAALDLIYKDLSQSDALDILGLPFAQDGRTHSARPQWLDRTARPCAIFLDEIARAQPIVLSSILELVTERKIDALGFTLPDHVSIIAACTHVAATGQDHRPLPHASSRSCGVPRQAGRPGTTPPRPPSDPA